MKNFTISLFFTLFSTSLFAQINPFYFNVLDPFPVSGFWINSELGQIDPGSWGWDGQITSTIAGELVYAEIGADNERWFCEENTIDYTGKFVLIDRGGCEFGEKALFAQQQGAAAVVIANVDFNTVVTMAGGSTGSQVTIPVIMIPNNISLGLAGTLLDGEQVNVSLSTTPMARTVLQGKLAKDDDGNCIYDNGETLLGQFRVNIEKNGETKTVFSNSQGEYFASLEAGDYTVVMDPPAIIWNACPPESITVPEDVTVNLDLAATPALSCPWLTIDISTPRLRRCFNNNKYHINFCNLGTEAANDAYFKLTLPGLISIVNASQPYEDLGNNIYEFQVGSLEVNECGAVMIEVEVSCDAMLRETLCANVEIFPRVECGAPTVWSNVDVRTFADCDPNEGVLLSIVNNGTASMPNAINYRVILDDEVIETDAIQLEAGGQRDFTFPANGGTYRIETDVIETSMYSVTPSAAIEGCVSTMGTDVSQGFVTPYPGADYGAFYDEICIEIIGSFDPNDKQANIKGYGPKHYIDQNVGLEYKIRFQNTGTDTAFKVVILDTLSEFLNINTIRPIGASHPYEFSLENSILRVDFPGILLPDSTVNEPGSNGFVSFSIQQMTDVALESEINNRAGIYFDYNDPVITNTVMHTVGKDFIENSVGVQELTPRLFSIHPNPARTMIHIQFKGTSFDHCNFVLFDAAGKKLKTARLVAPNQFIHLSEFGPGVYFYEINESGILKGAGKIIKL